MYSQKSLLENDMMAWNEYGPEPWGTTGISYAAAILPSGQLRPSEGIDSVRLTWQP